MYAHLYVNVCTPVCPWMHTCDTQVCIHIYAHKQKLPHLKSELTTTVKEIELKNAEGHAARVSRKSGGGGDREDKEEHRNTRC